MSAPTIVYATDEWREWIDAALPTREVYYLPNGRIELGPVPRKLTSGEQAYMLGQIVAQLQGRS